jgi:hypothetical protein
MGVLGRKCHEPAAETRRFAALRLTKGARRPQVSEQALGAPHLALGAPDRAAHCVVLCSGAWGQSCRGPMRSFRSIFLLFLLVFQLEQN